MIGVIQLQVGDHAQTWAELHQGSVGFIRLSHKQFPLAGVAIAAQTGNDAADDSGRVLIGLQQQGGISISKLLPLGSLMWPTWRMSADSSWRICLPDP